MSLQEIKTDYLTQWLNQLIESGIINREHLIYQNIDAFLTEQLSQPNPVTNWEQWPTLYSYCESLSALATRKGYMFYLGSKRFGLKKHRDIVAQKVSYCNPGPSLCTLDSRKLTPIYNSSPHLNNLMLLLTLLNTLDGVPCFKAPGLKKFFTIVHYDGMPLNIGTFPRQENGETFFDGIIPTIKLRKMRELYQEGNNAVHKFITENCTWVSEVNECDICDASGKVHLNVFTRFGSMGGDAESVERGLTESLKCIEASSNFLLSGNGKNCKFASLGEVCNRCKTLDVEKEPCMSAKCIHVSSDQASSQRRAHMNLNEKSLSDMNNPDYRSYGFGLLHFCKNCISSLRHYRLTDMSGTFFVAQLSSVGHLIPQKHRK
ncbi:Hypothetical predicted protein [Paramuricea clavata]|uniref:Uncharacterized protein n=1 Tax=Paramuricea clavata TaxID=317549 RepID=A0A7D9K3G6_PARCT|nr:Hypothetical predicted protein [Paramuricea clavata]